MSPAGCATSRAASAELRARTETTRIAVVAARLGAALALEAAAADPAVHRLALWEPVLDVDGYLRNLLRVNVTTQMVVHKKVMRNSEQLLADMASGGTVSVNGYKLSQGFVAGLQTLKAGRTADRLENPGARHCPGGNENSGVERRGPPASVRAVLEGTEERHDPATLAAERDRRLGRSDR